VLASSVEAFFDFDAQESDGPKPPGGEEGRQSIQVRDELCARGDDVLARCFRFRYERSGGEYYGTAVLAEEARSALWRHTLGTVAVDVPMLLAFLLLLSTRSGLPQRVSVYKLLNRARRKSGKRVLLDHIEVRAPLLPEYVEQRRVETRDMRRGPRLHHVRGHLVRRGSQLFWRFPHLRGNARAGSVQTRAVVWTFNDGCNARADFASKRAPLGQSGERVITGAAAQAH
jgi:hypothetical protein